jgi:hypothetical protein
LFWINFKQQETNVKKLKLKLELAKFLQETVEEVGAQTLSGSSLMTQTNFNEFMQKVAPKCIHQTLY